ncbi:MAG: M15 family metallopeptidase [Candidatus Hydrogenedentes bacterium]|nr:M15 family metallopeptidase [Candidatus Hydrogenedentota bacterium]
MIQGKQVKPCSIWRALAVIAAAVLSALHSHADGSPSELGAEDLLIAAYPQALVHSDNSAEILWRDGTRMALDNGLVKASFEDLLNKASILDQVMVQYPAGWPFDRSRIAADPGRVRNEAFFRKLYGNTQKSVEDRLVDVPWPNGTSPERVRFTSINGAADALAAVRDEIGSLGPKAARIIARPNGTFNWRPIAGTQRLSMHSFGAAIDFDLPGNLSRYWRWDGKEAGTYPSGVLEDDALGAVVRAFEKHGFIWGGKWGHYDTVHFEYRPELLRQESVDSKRVAKVPADR